jgi:hypothetical protein
MKELAQPVRDGMHVNPATCPDVHGSGIIHPEETLNSAVLPNSPSVQGMMVLHPDDLLVLPSDHRRLVRFFRI